MQAIEIPAPCLGCGLPTTPGEAAARAREGLYCLLCAPTARAERQAVQRRSAAHDQAARRARTGETPRSLGYDAAWVRLSRRARARQPWCSDCGTRRNLTTDHLPIAWERHEAGLVVRLCDVDVVCGPCNTARGSSRPGSARCASEVSSAERTRIGTQPSLAGLRDVS